MNGVLLTQGHVRVPGTVKLVHILYRLQRVAAYSASSMYGLGGLACEAASVFLKRGDILNEPVYLVAHHLEGGFGAVGITAFDGTLPDGDSHLGIVTLRVTGLATAEQRRAGTSQPPARRRRGP